MELWIRSQNKKKLYNVKNLELDNLETGICYESRDNFVLLGKYKSKERALEVLDDIQNFMTIEIHENNINYEQGDLILKGKIVDSLCKIYQMPKE